MERRPSVVDTSKYAGDGDQPKDISKSTWARMIAARNWILWKELPSGAPGVKPRKVPCYPDDLSPREKTDTPEDRARLGSYNQVCHIARGNPKFKIGFVLGPDGMHAEDGHPLGWQGVDRDGAIISKIEAEKLGGGYIEHSPSGNGSHWITYGRLFKAKIVEHDTYNEEFYSHGRFFTITHSQVYDGPIIDIYDRVDTGKPDEKIDSSPQPHSVLSAKELKDLRSALMFLDPGPYDNWFRVLMVLRQVEGGQEIAHEWSSRSDKHKEREFKKKFETVGEPVGHWKSIFQWAKESGWDPVAEAARGPSKGPFVAIEYDLDKPKAIEYVLDGFVMCGSTVISGSAGVGKTSIIGPWAAIICHLTQKNILTPTIRRPVYYFTEDPDQLVRILRGMKKMGMLTAEQDEVKQWLKIIPATRRSTEDFVQNLQLLKDAYDQDPVFYNGYKVEPLFILDTAVSNLAIKDIKDNSEISGVVNDIRVAVGKASIWFVTHIPKALKGAEPEQMSAIGAAAWGGDTQAEMIIFKNEAPPSEDGKALNEEERRVMLGKHRFDAAFTELVCHTDVVEETVLAEWGEQQPIRYRAAVVFTESTSKERKKVVAKARAEKAENDLNYNIMSMVSDFKNDLEFNPGGLFFATVPGTPKLPEGAVRRSINQYMSGIKRSPENRKAVWDAFCDVRKPADVPGGQLFRRQEIQDV
jgi:hypothetical protein